MAALPFIKVPGIEEMDGVPMVRAQNHDQQ